jgi:hypothetical protein
MWLDCSSKEIEELKRRLDVFVLKVELEGNRKLFVKFLRTHRTDEWYLTVRVRGNIICRFRMLLPWTHCCR